MITKRPIGGWSNFEVAMMTMFIAIIFYLLGLLSFQFIPILNGSILSESLGNENCTGLDLVSTSRCLNQDLNKWFFYNLSNVNKKMTLDEFKTIGGVCSHATEYYISQMEALGFNGKSISFFPKNSKFAGHEIALVYSEDMKQYCVLDQGDILGCNYLKQVIDNGDGYEVVE